MRTQDWKQGKSWTEIRTIKTEIDNIGKSRKKKLGLRIWQKDLRKIKRLISKKSGLINKKTFKASGVMNINRKKRCRILRTGNM